jgi:hypothetical protein
MAAPEFPFDVERAPLSQLRPAFRCLQSATDAFSRSLEQHNLAQTWADPGWSLWPGEDKRRHQWHLAVAREFQTLGAELYRSAARPQTTAQDVAERAELLTKLQRLTAHADLCVRHSLCYGDFVAQELPHIYKRD